MQLHVKLILYLVFGILFPIVSGSLPQKTCNICGHISGVACFSKTQYFKCKSAIIDASKIFQCPTGLMCNDSLEFCSTSKLPVCETGTQLVLNSQMTTSVADIETGSEQTTSSLNWESSEILNNSSKVLDKLVVIFLQVNLNVTSP